MRAYAEDAAWLTGLVLRHTPGILSGYRIGWSMREPVWVVTLTYATEHVAADMTLKVAIETIIERDELAVMNLIPTAVEVGKALENW